MGTGYEFILDCGIDSVVSDHELDIILQKSNSSDSVPIHKKKKKRMNQVGFSQFKNSSHKTSFKSLTLNYNENTNRKKLPEKKNWKQSTMLSLTICS